MIKFPMQFICPIRSAILADYYEELGRIDVAISLRSGVYASASVCYAVDYNDGYGYGSGSGYGNGHGHGQGYDDGSGDGYGSGYGYGLGCDDSSGDGYGGGSSANFVDEDADDYFEPDLEDEQDTVFESNSIHISASFKPGYYTDHVFVTS